MMFKIVFFSLFLLLSFRNLSPLHSDAPLIVRLDTEIELMQLFVSSFQKEDTPFSDEYLASLSEILFFDIAHGGRAELVKSRELEERIKKILREDPSKVWSLFKEKNVPCALIVTVSDKELQAKLFSCATHSVKSVEEIPLTGKIHQDRAIIHQFSDKVHKVLFGIEGIAKTKILYTVRQKMQDKNEWTSDIWEMDYDGGRAHPVIENSGYLVTPQYSPAKAGGRPGSILYVSYKSGIPKMYTASLSEKKGERLTLMKGNQLMPTLNQQKDTLAFIADSAGNPDLFIMEFGKQGSKPKQVFSAKWGSQGTPTFSPDGKKLAFVSNKDGSPRIYSVDISHPWNLSTDLKPELITKFRRGCTAPAWSYDGKKIAYSAPSEGILQIFVYDLERGVETQLTQGIGNKENPSWAPNSHHIVFNNNLGNSSEICFINLHQKKIVRVTRGGDEKRFPHWEPYFSH